MKFKKREIRTPENKHEHLYEDEHGKIYKELTDVDFHELLEKLKFNDDFALPDRLVQDFVNDGSIMPTFKRSVFFNKLDMDELVKTIRPYRKKKKYPLIITKKNPKHAKKHKRATKRKINHKKNIK